MPTRYRCRACGNVTRFDVVEDEQVLDERVEGVVCRWCNASGAQIEVLDSEQLHDQPS
jgi:hypothetical protein